MPGSGAKKDAPQELATCGRRGQ